MASKKHLVLSPDVHQKLRKKKEETGLTLTEIGNSILRVTLSRPSFGEMVGQKLIEMGRISPVDYEQALAHVLSESKGSANPFVDLLHVTPNHTLIGGCWEGKERYVAADRSHQIIEWWVATEDAKEPPRSHYHEQAGIIVCLLGGVQIKIDAESHVLGAGDSVPIPARVLHTVTPLTDNARTLQINMPAWPDFLTT